MKVAYIFNRYPVLSQRFLQREIDALRGHGIEVEAFSIFGGAEKPEIRARRADTYLSAIPATAFAVRHARKFRARGIQLAHGAWAAAPATAAAVLHRLCDMPFSFGAHAYDLYRHGGDPFLRAKMRAAAFVHTTTSENVSYLKTISPKSAAKVVLARRGLEKMPLLTERADELPKPLRILSVGRLVEKKGHRHQLAAAEFLRKMETDFRLRIIGDGPLRAQLENEIAERGLTAYVSLDGALLPEQVDDAYREANIFWHTGIIDAEGDRDGLPNVVPEAMAHQLPVISFRAPGVMEAVHDGATGLLAQNEMELAQATRRLCDDAKLRRALGRNARAWVEENFLAERNTKILADAFRHAVASD